MHIKKKEKKKSEIKEEKILLISFFAGLAFAIVELVFSIFSHSQSVLMDAVYDATELIFIALILFLTPLFYKPVSEKRPYGFFQIESIFIIIKGFMMLSVSASVLLGIIEKAFSGGNPVNEMSISIFQLILAIVSAFIYLIMKKLNKALSSPTVNAELLGWKLDISYSLGMSLAFLISSALSHTSLAFLSPYFDSIIAVVIMIFMLPENIAMLKDSIKDIFLFSPGHETVDSIKNTCEDILKETPYDLEYCDIIKTGRHMWVSVYFKTKDEKVSVASIREMTETINKEVGKFIENCTCELILLP